MKSFKTMFALGAFLIMTSAAFSQTAAARQGFVPGYFLGQVVSTIVFGLLGIVLAILGFKLFDIFVPFNLEQEICEKNNQSVALLCGAMVLGVCLIIAATILSGN